MTAEAPSRHAADPDRIRISFELTDGCDLACVHCFKSLADPVRFLDVGLAERVLDQARGLGLEARVGLTGGEPTLHPELGRIVAAATTRGFPVSIVTNGWGFEQALPTLLEHRLGLEAVTFSLDGATAASHDAVRRAGSFRKVVAALESCRLHGLTTQVNMVVTRSNRCELDDMVRLVSALGCRALGLAHCKLTPGAMANNLTMSARERRRLEADIAALQRTYRLAVLLAGDHFEDYPVALCTQLELRELHVDVRGRLTSCCELSAHRGGRDSSDVVADLACTPLQQAVSLLAERTVTILREKAGRFAKGEMREVDHFVCTQCFLHYGKVPDDWLQPAATVKPGPD